MRKPVIAISATTFEDPHYDFPGYPRTVINEDYPRSITAAGGVPLLLAPGTDIAVVADQLAVVDAVVLSGGYDVNPLRYGQQPHLACQPPSLLRDAYEWEVLRVAEERGLPVLGVCRGMQLINVFYGGTLYQDLAEVPTTLRHNQGAYPGSPTHGVALTGFAAEALGVSETVVNSFHHQVIHDLADGFAVAATAPDGVVEAIERPGERLLVGVQWHPEMLSRSNAEAQALFRWFVDRVRPA